MSRRYHDPDIWTKLYGTKSSTKLVACCLHNSSPNSAGIFRIRPEEVAMKTGLKVTEVEAALVELNDRKYVMWDRDETLVFLVGYAQVQGMNPKVSRSITSELVRLGPSPLTVQAAHIPQLRAQDPEGWDRVSIAYAEAMHTLQSVCLSEGGEFEGGKTPRKRPAQWVETLLDAMRQEWPRGEDGKLYRFDRASARRELLKIPKAERPEVETVVEGVKRWTVAWAAGYQHNASRFVRDRLWDQAANGKAAKQQPVTSRPLIKDLTKGEV